MLANDIFSIEAVIFFNQKDLYMYCMSVNVFYTSYIFLTCLAAEKGAKKHVCVNGQQHSSMHVPLS